MSENLVVLKVSNIPIFGTISIQVYKDTNERDPKVILDSNPEIQDDKAKFTIDKLLKTLSIQTDLADMHFEGDDLVFNVHRKHLKGTVDTLGFDGKVKFKDYNQYLRDVDEYEKKNHLSIVDATTEKDKIGTVDPSNEYLVTLRDFMHKIEGSASKIKLNEKMYEEAERALKEEKSKDGLLARLKKLKAINNKPATKKISRENKYAGKSMQLSEKTREFLAGVAVIGIGTAAVAGIAQVVPGSATADLPSQEALSGYSYSTDIDREAILANGAKNRGEEYVSTTETTEETTTEYNEQEEEIKYLHEEYGFDISFIRNLYKTGLSFDEVRQQLMDLSETMNESSKQR